MPLLAQGSPSWIRIPVFWRGICGVFLGIWAPWDEIPKSRGNEQLLGGKKPGKAVFSLVSSTFYPWPGRPSRKNILEKNIFPRFEQDFSIIPEEK